MLRETKDREQGGRITIFNPAQFNSVNASASESVYICDYKECNW